MADHDLGALKAEEDKPAIVQWRWYDSKPTLPLWGVLLFLLIKPRENRNWRTWLILVVPLLAATFRWLVPNDSAGLDLMLQWIVTFSIAWTSVWLLAPYLGSRSRPAAFASTLAVMFGVGIIGYVGYFGLWFDSDTTVSVFIFWAIGSVFLLLALMLSGVCSRKHFHPGRIAAWLILWLPLLTGIGMVIAMMAVGIVVGGVTHFSEFLMIVPAAAMGSVIVSAFLYLVNLPVLVLAGFTNDYRQRLETMVCGNSPAHSPLAESNPFEQEQSM